MLDYLFFVVIYFIVFVLVKLKVRTSFKELGTQDLNFS